MADDLHFGCTHGKHLYCYNQNILSRATRSTRRSFDASEVIVELYVCGIYEPRREKTGLRGFRPGPTQTGLYKLRKELEA